ncbi:MAG: class I SAM-dependent methyltransferase [Rhodospirillales bacterium]|nr:class I SAM-dependent methyltransferase [Rhodospirillales bacterium]
MTPFDATHIAIQKTTEAPLPSSGDVPEYMHDVYDWAYLNPRNVRLLDREIIVSLILWGNSHRLQEALLCEIDPAASVLQAAHVYGDLIPRIAATLAHPGQLEVIEVAPVQAGRCREKLRDYPEVEVRIADVASLRTTPRDLVSCFFLLHEIPTDYKCAVVNTLLNHVAEGGKAVFVDYHRSHWLHPLRPLMRVVFDWLEPFARELQDHDIAEYADDADAFIWRKETYFGGLYQKTVAERR